jgi:hypothetical protein
MEQFLPRCVHARHSKNIKKPGTVAGFINLYVWLFVAVITRQIKEAVRIKVFVVIASFLRIICPIIQ